MQHKILINGLVVVLPISTDSISDIKVITEDIEYEDGRSIDIHQTFTHEGVIVDVIDQAEVPEEVIATSSITYTELVEDMLDEEAEYEDIGFRWTTKRTG